MLTCKMSGVSSNRGSHEEALNYLFHCGGLFCSDELILAIKDEDLQPNTDSKQPSQLFCILGLAKGVESIRSCKSDCILHSITR